jgi:hypothetical protein
MEEESFMASRKTKPRRSFRVGDRVRIKRYRTWISWGKRKPQKFGFIESINGAYILVRPRWNKHTIEMYDVEIALAN